MKKTMIQVWMVLAMSATIVSCGDDKKDDKKTENAEKGEDKTKKTDDGVLDVNMSGIKGTIELPSDTKLVSGTDSRQEGKVIQFLSLDINGISMDIHPEMPSLEEIKVDLTKWNKPDNETVVIIEEGDDYFFYSEKFSNYDGKGGEPTETTGYSWYYTVNDGGKTYTLHVEQNWKPLTDEKVARDLLKAARTFKPAK
jgi:hypothetical protein